jgi:subtilase family serine protease
VYKKQVLSALLCLVLLLPTISYGHLINSVTAPQAWGDGDPGSNSGNATSLSKISSAKNLTQYLDPKSSAFQSPSSWQKHLLGQAFSSPLKAHHPIHVKRHFQPSEIVPFVSSSSTLGTSPSQIWSAYDLNSLNCSMTGYQWGDSHLCGYGQVIGIVDWYYDPNIESDLGTFSQFYGLPSCTVANGCLNISVENGAPTDPNVPDNSPTDLEISLDVEWAHAITPGAKILLVNSASNSLYDIFGGSGFVGAVNVASQSPGVHQVSMSFGAPEFSSENTFDSTFQVPGVSFFAASGDSGIGTSYPAASPYVVSVGGTVLNFDNAGNLQSETAWSGSGGGYGTNEAEPSYQTNYGISGNNMRAQPDVAASATNFLVYDSILVNGQSGWYLVYGTSASTPLWTSMTAIANSEHSNPLSSTSFGTQNAIYNAASGAKYATNFRDIISGNNGNCAICNAGPGYDFVTGLGSPITNNLNPFLSPQPPTGSTLADQASCQALGGTWGTGSTCTIANLVINSGDSLTINSGVTLTVTGTIANSGTISNSGTIHNSGTISGSGKFTSFMLSVTNTGTITDPVTIPSGTLSSSYTLNFPVIVPSGATRIINSGVTFTINPGVVVTINSGGTISNLGTIANSGTVNNSGIINNHCTATITGNPVNNIGSGKVNNPCP